MTSLKARFTPAYSLTVLAVSAGLFALAWYMLAVRGFGWSLSAAGITIRENALKLAAMSPLMLAVFGTQLWDLLRPRDILVLTPRGLHDRRLTRGEVRWDQVARIHLYRKGWQRMALIEPKPLTADPDALKLGPMPLYAFNRLCARWLKRPELNVGLGGMTVSSSELEAHIRRYFRGEVIAA